MIKIAKILSNKKMSSSRSWSFSTNLVSMQLRVS